VFLNGMSFSKLAARIYDVDKKLLRFKIDPSEGPTNEWAAVLGRPDFNSRAIQVSLGYKGEAAAFPSRIQKPLQLQIINVAWLWIWVVVFALLVAVFGLCVTQSNIIRDGSPLGFEPGKKTSGTFSLSKWQGAWWFFVILSTYLFIGLVTGQFASSINSTAL